MKTFLLLLALLAVQCSGSRPCLATPIITVASFGDSGLISTVGPLTIIGTGDGLTGLNHSAMEAALGAVGNPNAQALAGTVFTGVTFDITNIVPTDEIFLTIGGLTNSTNPANATGYYAFATQALNPDGSVVAFVAFSAPFANQFYSPASGLPYNFAIIGAPFRFLHGSFAHIRLSALTGQNPIPGIPPTGVSPDVQSGLAFALALSVPEIDPASAAAPLAFCLALLLLGLDRRSTRWMA